MFRKLDQITFAPKLLLPFSPSFLSPPLTQLDNLVLHAGPGIKFILTLLN